MTDPTNDIVVAVAPGTGRIARRPGALLFDPTGENAALIERFDAADDDHDAIIAVKQHLIDEKFEVAPLVVIDWREGAVGLLVFGDTDIRSSAPAAPMISGAGSGTWIERELGALELGQDAEAQVWCGDESDPATDLRLGIVRGGGVKVIMTRALPVAEVLPAPVPDAVAAQPAPEPAERPGPPPANEAERFTPPPSTVPPEPAFAAAPPAPVAPPAPAAPPAPVAPPAPAAPMMHTNGSAPPAAPAQPGFVAEPGGIDWTNTDPQAAQAAGAVAVVADPFVEEAPAPPIPPAPPVVEPDIFEDAVTTPLETFPEPDQPVPNTGGLVEAIVCENGHHNPPQDRMCRTCAVEIDPNTAVSLIGQPSLGFIRFPDGTGVEIDKTHVIGRKPPIGLPATQPVIVDHAEVSRSHVEITLDGWSVLVTDLGSRNGTWVIPPSDPTPIKLEGHVPYVLEHGTAVHLGGPEASFTYDFGVD